MALPYAIRDDSWQGGAKSINETMSESVANQERERSPGIYYLGSGAFGLASDIGGGKVKKYTLSSREADRAKILMNNDGRYAVPKIYSVEMVQDSTQGKEIWAITMDKVELLDRKYWDAWKLIMEYRNYAPNGWEASIDDVMLCLSKYARAKISDKEKEWLCHESLRFKSLEELGLLWDAKGRNIGLNAEGHLLLFDLG